MSKDIYDSLIPKGIREILEIQDKLNSHLPIADQFYSSRTQSNIYSGLSADILEKINLFNSINYPSTIRDSSISMIESLSNSTIEAMRINAGTIGYLEKFDALSRHSILSEKLQPWNEALKIQAALELPTYIENSLHGFNLDRSIFQGFISESEYERALEITSALNTDSVFFGEFEASYEFEKEDADDSEERSKIILPEEFRERLETVQFLPIKLFEQISNDPNLMRGMDPREFENLIAELMYKSGFENIIVTPRSNDKGRDILATKTVCDIPIMFAFECKRYSPKNKIKPEIMRALLGTISHHQTKANKGVLVTTSSFSRDAKSFIASESMLSGKDFNDLVNWINQVKK
jgi:hypothetical protein